MYHIFLGNKDRGHWPISVFGGFEELLAWPVMFFLFSRGSSNEANVLNFGSSNSTISDPQARYNANLQFPS